MSKQNPFTNRAAMIANRLVSPFTVFAKQFASFFLARSRRNEASFAPPTLATVASDNADSRHAEESAAGGHESALTGPLPAVAMREKTVPILQMMAPEQVPIRPAPNSATIDPSNVAPQVISPTLAADPALDAIRARLETLETQVVDLEIRKAEMEQLIAEFAYCQYLALGELVGEQLRLQHELLSRRAERSSRPEDRQAAAAAADEYQAYQKARDEPDLPQLALAESEREELKTLYRAAVMRCHPDRVGEAEKPMAHEMFLRTQDAYQRRDLESMRLISSQLAVGDSSSPSNNGTTPRERLEGLRERLLDKGADLLLTIQSIQMQPQYRQARNREQWDDYFATARKRLDAECEALRRQLSAC